MPQRIGVFSEDNAKRIARGIRSLEGAPGTFLRVPERIPRGSSGSSSTTRTDPPAFTVVELTPSTGEPIGYMDRGRRRFLFSATELLERCVFYSSDGFLYSVSGGWINKSNGVLIKWNITTSSADAFTPIWYSTEGAMTSPGAHLSTDGTISGTMGNSASFNSNFMENLICEASDGAIWVCGGTNGHIASFDPDTGAQTVDISGITGDALYAADGSGGVLLVDAAGTGGKYLRVFDSSGSETASWSTSALTFVEVASGVIVLSTGSSATLKTLNLDDLTEISSRSAPAGETYIAGTTDGTTVWVSTAHATTPKYRSYDATNLATENWNANRDTTNATSAHMRYANSAIYDWSQRVRKINASTGAEIWEFTGANTAINKRIDCAVTGSYVYAASNGNLMFAIDDSTGEAAWTESMSGNVWGGVVVGGGRLFAAGRRTPT